MGAVLPASRPANVIPAPSKEAKNKRQLPGALVRAGKPGSLPSVLARGARETGKQEKLF